MTKTVSTRAICFIQAIVLLCEHGHFSLNSASGILSPPPILLGLRKFPENAGPAPTPID